ncbi:MAG: galactokinase [Gammaproteobacteria bacterium]|nr:galactokinase [Gammaproteobacteria bacterium]
MIITRSPFRITLGGGGTDLPFYYKDYEGFLLAGAIDKYVYITLNHAFNDEIIIKYSKLERVKNINDIEHPIIRETMRYLNLNTHHLEISSIADIPAGTGLGSSGSFTTALLKAFHTWQKNLVHPHELAEQACHIELDILREPIGKQDQYIAAYGGLTCFHFAKNGTVTAVPLKISAETMYNLEDNLILFFTGYSRSASNILGELKQKSKDSSIIDNLHFVKDLGLKSKVALEVGDLNEFANLMNVHWEHKKQLSQNISNSDIDNWYKLALKNGALGGKVIGAGGGGFLMFYAHDKMKLRHALQKIGLIEMRFRFDFLGAQIVVQS